MLSLVYEHKWKALSLEGPEGIGLQFIPHYGMGVGNLFVYAGAGAELRMGWRLPGDFGAQLIQPGGFRGPSPGTAGRSTFFVFAAADRKAVARNLLLDGNTFRDSHSVEKEVFTSDFLLGGGLAFWRMTVEVEQVFWTRKFTTESRRQTFSSLSLRHAY